MTRLEAVDRAARIWGPIVAHIEPSCWQPHAAPCFPEWFVDLTGDDRGHSFDCNGHVMCGHVDCVEREARLGTCADCGRVEEFDGRVIRPIVLVSGMCAACRDARAEGAADRPSPVLDPPVVVASAITVQRRLAFIAAHVPYINAAACAGTMQEGGYDVMTWTRQADGGIVITFGWDHGEARS